MNFLKVGNTWGYGCRVHWNEANLDWAGIIEVRRKVFNHNIKMYKTKIVYEAGESFSQDTRTALFQTLDDATTWVAARYAEARQITQGGDDDTT